MANTQAIPKGYHTVTPSLFVAGAAKAIDFYKKALGAEEIMRFPAPDGTIMHAEIRIGDSELMLGDEMPDHGGKSPKTLGGTPVSFFIYQDNVDAAWKRAIEAGGKEVMPLKTSSGATAPGASWIRSATAGGWPSTSGT